jgi:hypothetical protein
MRGHQWQSISCVVLALVFVSRLVFAQPASSIDFMPLPAGATACANGPSGVVDGIGCYVSPLTPNADIWTINKPRVDVKELDLPNIKTSTGDLVSVFAGGCVQTGGRGQTWKRYVIPITGGLTHDEDHLYFGSISIEGAIPEQRLKSAVTHGAFEVQSVTANSFVHLFYSDNGYGDNGYTGHDDGTWMQCDGLPDAFAVIAIQHGCLGTNSSSSPCLRGMALDLTSDERDANGLVSNPTWTFSHLTSTLAPVVQLCSLSTKMAGQGEDNFQLCATNTQKNTYFGCWNVNDVGDIRGHVNFGPIEYEVRNDENEDSNLNLDGHEWDDDDYTWNISRPDMAMYTFGRSDKIQMEFDSEETIDRFTEPEWKTFHNAVDAGGDQYPNFNNLMRGAHAIIVGEAGVDCPHGCIPELHPVYGLAIHMARSTLADDYWVFFARNWGDEGYCGRNTATFATPTLNFQLPMAFATDISITSQNVQGVSAPSSPTLTLNDKGAVLSIPLADPSKHSWVDGQFHLAWKTHFPLGLIDRPISIRRFPIDIAKTPVKPNGASKSEDPDDPALTAKAEMLSHAEQVRLRSLMSTPNIASKNLFVTIKKAPIAVRAINPKPSLPVDNPAYTARISKLQKATSDSATQP